MTIFAGTFKAKTKKNICKIGTVGVWLQIY